MHAENGSGEMHIQFWFHAARSGCGQSDTEQCHVTVVFEKLYTVYIHQC